jgi:hypothetical protein
MQKRSQNSCEICRSESQDLSVCKICGSSVCPLCLDGEESICSSCKDALCQICGDYLSSRACNECGRLVCEDHGIRVNESTVCDVCRERLL